MRQEPDEISAGADPIKTILLVEDHPFFSALIKRAIEELKAYRVVHIKEGSRLLEALHEYQPHLLMLDYELPGQNGIELYDLVHATPGWEHLPAVIVSADPPEQALALRNIRGLLKPFSLTDLTRAIERALATE